MARRTALGARTSRRVGMTMMVGALLGGSGLALGVRADEPPIGAKSDAPVVVKRASRVDAYAKVLGLDEQQSEAARQLHDAMTAEQQKVSRRVREEMREAEEDRKVGEHAMAEERMDKALRTQRESSKKLTTQFLDDLKLILRADQQDNWVKLEQYRRREMYLRGGGVGGSSVDLTKVVDQLKLTGDVRTKAADVLSQYEPDLDKALRERERNAQDDEKTFGGVQRFDEKTMKAHMERERAADMRVREVNLRYLKQLVGVLPEEMGKKLEEQYQLKAYRSAYRSTKTGKNIADAGKLKGLTDEQRRRLDALAEKYARDARAAGDRIAAAMQRADDEGGGGGTGIMIGGPGMFVGESQNPELSAARSDRRAVDSEARQQLEQILTPDQLAELPKAETGGPGRRIEVMSDGADEMVFIADVDEEDLPPGDGGVMIIRTVEVSVPGGHKDEPQTSPKPD